MEKGMNKVQSIKYFGGMALCVILSVLIFVFGEHDIETEDAGKVDLKYEQMDGDLDFGQTGDSVQSEQPDAGEQADLPTTTPEGTPSDENGQNGAGTVDNPLLIADDWFRYQIINGKATVIELINPDADELVIPQKIEGYPVKIIGEYLCQGASKLQRVTLPEGLTEIGAFAFENCDALENITFPTTLTTIRDSAFFACDQLTKVELPENTVTIEDYAFFACDNLTELSLYQTSDLSMIFDLSIVTKVSIGEGVSFIAESAFEYCDALVEVNLPSTLTSIKAYAFFGCTALERLVLPQSLMSISENVFENCTALQTINLPDGLMMLGEYAFCGCEALQVLEIPDEIANIGYGAFDGCEQLMLQVAEESTGADYAMANDLLYEYKE